jgi:hypothetical protein
MISTPDAMLKLTGQGAWRGLDKSNGVVMIGDHVPRISTSFSRLVITPALAALGLPGVPFGNAVWFDDNQIAADPATVYTGFPTAPGAVPRLAGIIPLEQGVMSGFPTHYDPQYGYLMLPHMKMRLMKNGFIWYKFGMDGNQDPVAYGQIHRGMSLFAQNATGLPVFAEGHGPVLPDVSGASTVADLVTALSLYEIKTPCVPVLDDATYIGRIIHIEPENESVLVAFGFEGGL